MRTKVQMTKQSVMKAVRGGASSLTAVWRACGGTGNIAGSTSAKIRTLVPDIEGRLQKNKAGAAKPSPKKSAKKTTKVKTKKASPTEYPRHETNPYREGSAYATTYDVLASAGDKGFDRAKLVRHVDHPASAFADFLQQLVATDRIAGLLADATVMNEGRGRTRITRYCFGLQIVIPKFVSNCGDRLSEAIRVRLKESACLGHLCRQEIV